jgi:alpha-tubulin suppressor-like RCC1 family protein
MGKNLIRKTYKNKDFTFTVPAGVRFIDFKLSYEAEFGITKHAGGKQLIDTYGNLYSWGGGAQVGDGTNIQKNMPVHILVGRKFVALPRNTCEVWSCYAIQDGGMLWAWGNNSWGQLGNGTSGNSLSVPVSVSINSTFLRVDFGENHFIGLTHQKRIVTCGRNNNGQIGNNSTSDISTPQIVGNFNTKDVFAFRNISAAIDEDDKLYMWGINTSGQLGVGTTNNRSTPTAVLGNKSWSKVESNGDSTYAIESDTKLLYSWGLNDYGQLGHGTTTNRSSPVAVLGNKKVKDVKVGGWSAYFLTEDNELYSIGRNNNGQLGIGSTQNQSSPVLVATNVREINHHTYAQSAFYFLDFNDDIYSFGEPYFGALGINAAGHRSTPTLVVGGYKWAKLVSEGGITKNGELLRWGPNASGLVGNNSVNDVSSPVKVATALNPLLNNLIQVSSTKFEVTPGQVLDIKMIGGIVRVNNTYLGTCYGIPVLELSFNA